MNRTVWWRKLVAIIELQLLMMLISLPLIIAWGMPLSLISIIGNIIFGPFVLVFLVISSLIFVTQLMMIPNTWLIMMLELVYKVWMYIASYANQRVLLELPAPPTWVLWIMFMGACAALVYRFKYSTLRGAWFGLMLILNCGGAYLICKPSHGLMTFEEGAKKLSFIKADDHLICVDHGSVVRGKLKSSSWLTYTVLPELRKCFGTTRVDEIYLLKPTAASAAMASLIVAESPACTVRVAACDGHVPASIECALKELNRWCQNHGYEIKPVVANEIVRDAKAQLAVHSDGALQRTARFAQQALSIDGTINDEKISLHQRLTRREQERHQFPQVPTVGT